ncbi:DNA gyrase/topoisomerase IV subunit A [Acidipropionibacterium jensenii]|uniref:DNA topoisomerase (ATP-hydrolyzing) n=1 Tax=Acidipropionibacterium jensenii TaxID=1749 RepID=A0A448NWB2_9ACTN|nr:DNA topoisomerase IV subunit A [Acidipropionibacterium jensenii]MDN5995305.1 DNA topoisomerase IV subunit A [Acidipropionibacterium jensenii]MDN6440438.1 DNA topoisomerase IV subunit A [Acidipropionibacterium jensenii]MDN6479309.1 DNA topoisomerase IV subunit A [Acidipropionibacterium jensenii]MDN6511803.1 DNA topoisomerase IV subunit A [Acidipropionibacterium jensenii]MDN6591045.1 DNA topoisomerase IV subunit A [Acidipropionibacterium jensenii]
MARSTVDDDFTENIIDVDVSSEMENSYLEYAYSVIYSRALPDARDGLKPVQRRILYSMGDMGVRPDRPHVKSARVVGQVMGQLHPHGDSAIYDALVRMAQPWAMRLPLVDGHGNFGALDAGPAAMRYTECRMAPSAQAMIEGLDEDTVDFVPNYDGKETEPGVLPSAFPNLLVNGASGIAVGMATNIPTHNLVEVVAALRHLLVHPDADLDTMMRFIPGPDMPTGGRIVGLDGIRDAYATGRGTFRIRATTSIERVSPRRMGIVVTELPYMVGPEKIIDQIKTLVQSKRISGIADVKDLTDLANGTRLVIEVKNGINAEAMLSRLYRLTKLEDTFAVNAVALVQGQPRTLGLLDLLHIYLEHRLEVTLRRTTFRLHKAKDRLHLVEGLLTAIVDIDDVIAIIRSSQDASEARTRLIEAFDLDEIQANYILDMQLRRLTRYSTIELESERDDLLAEIDKLTVIATDDRQLRKVVSRELAAVSKTFGTPRRTVLLGSAGSAAGAEEPLEVPDSPSWVLLSSTGRLARVDTDEPLAWQGPRARHDTIASTALSSTRGEFGILTSAGRLIRARTIDLVSLPATATAPSLAGGSPVDELVDLAAKERVIGVTSLTGDGPSLALGTRNGLVKRVNPELPTGDSWEVITLKDGDEVVGVAECEDPEAQLCFVTSDAHLLHYRAGLVRPQGRKGSGIAGIRASCPVIFFGAVAPRHAVVVTVAAAAADQLDGPATSVKVTDLSEYPAKGRGTAGVRCHRFLSSETVLALAWVGSEPAVACTSDGSPVELPTERGRRDGSGDRTAAPVVAVASRRHGPASDVECPVSPSTAPPASAAPVSGGPSQSEGTAGTDPESRPGPDRRNREDGSGTDSGQPELFD